MSLLKMPANQDDDNLMIMTMITWQVYAPPEWVGEHHYHGEALSVWELGMITQVIINYTSTKRSNWGFRWDLAAYDHTSHYTATKRSNGGLV